METSRAETLVRLTLVSHTIARHLARSLPMTVNEYHCLTQLYLEKPCCVRKLTASLDIGSTLTSRILRSLEKKGWIIRTFDDTDKRMVRVGLTEQGAAVVRRILHDAEDVADQIADLLPPERRNQFFECLHNVTMHVTAISTNEQESHT